MRILVAVLIFLGDFCTPFIPLGSLFIAYVIIARPKWFKEQIEKLYVS